MRLLSAGPGGLGWLRMLLIVVIALAVVGVVADIDGVTALMA
jgi:hypothetical protein